MAGAWHTADMTVSFCESPSAIPQQWQVQNKPLSGFIARSCCSRKFLNVIMRTSMLLPMVNECSVPPFSYQNLSPTLSLRNCSALISLKRSPVTEPLLCCSSRPPAYTSMSSGELHETNTRVRWQRVSHVAHMTCTQAVATCTCMYM